MTGTNQTPYPLPSDVDPRPSGLARIAVNLTMFAERWIPDAFIFALVATFLVIAAASVRHGLLASIDLWTAGFWDLIPFTLQMSLVIISGYVLATTRPVFAAISYLASIPKSSKGAAAFIALFAMLSGWLNWGFSLIFSAMLAREIAHRLPRLDYRAAGASAFLGLGSIWAQGLSGSAALQMATPSALPAAIRAVVAAGTTVPGGMIPLRHTIFLWQSFVSVAVELVLVTVVVYLATPSDAHARSAAALGISLEAAPTLEEEARASVPGDFLERTPWLTWLFGALALVGLERLFAKGGGLNALNLNTLNLCFLSLGFILHGTPARMMRAFKAATPSIWGVILQFPFYAGIAAVITKTHLNAAIASLFVRASSRLTFPALIALYSAALGVFVPSGGSKWVIEAPYVMQAAHELHVHLGWMVCVYDLGEALANLVQPFWMLPVLGLLGLRARDVMGFTFLVFVVLLPVVLILVTVLGATLPYPL